MSEKEQTTSRKSFLKIATKFAIVGGFLSQGMMFIRSLAPNVLYEPVKRFKIGLASSFSEGLTFFPKARMFLIKQGNQVHDISAKCTHLGCTVNLYKLDKPETVTLRDGSKLEQSWEFHCPCHGSKFRGDGSQYAGPAPTDLPHWDLSMAPDGNLVVDQNVAVDKDTRMTL